MFYLLLSPLFLQSLSLCVAHEYTDMYPGMTKTAREEGFDDIAEWFSTLARAERSHAGRFQRVLDDVQSK